MENKLRKSVLKIPLFFAKLANIILPNYILLPFLTSIKKIPYGSKFVMFFDPNLIRKVYKFNLKPREFKLRTREPFEPHLYSVDVVVLGSPNSSLATSGAIFCQSMLCIRKECHLLINHYYHLLAYQLNLINHHYL